MIPYIGSSSAGSLLFSSPPSSGAIWMHSIGVTLIFIGIQNLEGFFYAPRIVGNYVGLHPMTVIGVDLCLGSDYWRGDRSAACRAAYRNSEGPVRRYVWGRHLPGTISADRNGSQIQTKSNCPSR